jgi:hypothetical protein
MTVLSELVEHHAEEEEDEMFVLATKLGDAELESLGAQLVARAKELAREEVAGGSKAGRR